MSKGILWSFIDFFSMMFAFFVVLFALNMQAKTEEVKGNIIDPSLFIATIEWPKDSRADVDIIMLLPTGEKIMFTSRDASLGVLDTDDLGNKAIDAVVRREVISLRKIIPGEYVVHVLLWAGRGETTKVKGSVMKLRGFEVVCEKGFVLVDNGTEDTICRFTLDADGNVVSKNQNFMGSIVR